VTKGGDADPVDAFLRRRRVAVCGATPRKEKWGYRVFRRLLDEGYDVVPVHPLAQPIDGIPSYESLDDVPGAVQAVSVITPPSASLEIVRQAAEMGKPPCWFQPGAWDDEVVAEAKRLGVPAIAGPCVLVELDARGGRPARDSG
jgi:predicted CoA-binding protein